MLSYDTVQLHLFSVLTEKVHQLLAAHTEHAAGHHRLDCSLRRTTVEAVGIVARKLALEREPSDVFPVITDAIRYILEAPLGDEAEPSCGVALALQLFALTVLHHLALALAKLTQRLNVNTVFPEFLFHRQWLFGCKVTKSFRDKSRGFGIKRAIRENKWPKIKLIAEFCRDSS